MKYLLILLTLSVSCKKVEPYDKLEKPKNVIKNQLPSHYDIYETKIDDCEYIILKQAGYAPSIIHKASCQNKKKSSQLTINQKTVSL